MGMVEIDREKKKARFLRYVLEGHTVVDACRLSGFSEATYYRYRKVDSKFKQRVINALDIRGKETVTKGLHKLAIGAVQVEEKTETFTKDEATGEYIKKSTKVTNLPPNVKALQLLASKHLPNEYNDNKDSNINITITQKDRALTIEDRLKILSKDAVEGEDIELDASDYKELGTEEE